MFDATQTHDYNNVRDITRMFPEDDNLFIQELFLHLQVNLGYDSARSVVKVRCAAKCIRRRVQAVFLMFISSTWL